MKGLPLSLSRAALNLGSSGEKAWETKENSEWGMEGEDLNYYVLAIPTW